MISLKLLNKYLLVLNCYRARYFEHLLNYKLQTFCFVKNSSVSCMKALLTSLRINTNHSGSHMFMFVTWDFDWFLCCCSSFVNVLWLLCGLWIRWLEKAVSFTLDDWFLLYNVYVQVSARFSLLILITFPDNDAVIWVEIVGEEYDWDLNPFVVCSVFSMPEKLGIWSYWIDRDQ